ncbi:GPW/gp25 family protein [Candidatus Microthrix sp.]|jgi:phage baseplate assembly protein W|uniref:GPW/gp25 family protein n=1 Tax=Candidatus Neomicrothrix sp. TaxID=2719034 RepID=UPI001B548ED0|nr:GPW/gp25 family protein [Candidatus Microthrix sp.]MBK6311935.1 GPW/gp25 family protein [Candidatus Microthrix sp.]MBP9051027.1 GPW/gp25 family protein [Ilumatobacteraceae bacterium]HMS49112.1 GPW/gp25 family protein [Candidatus Microthrix sp.]
MSAVEDIGARMYGQGVAFPFRVGLDGRVAWSTGEENVRESLSLIVQTRPGERIERPDFGCGVDRFLHEQVTVATLRRLQDEIRTAIDRWEPRVALDDVRLAADPADRRAVDITISYRLVASGLLDRLSLTMAVD